MVKIQNKLLKASVVLALLCFVVMSATYAQPLNWQHLDLHKDGVFGISTDKAYKELLKGKTATKIKVAVLDSGIDTQHEDLSAIIWRNPIEQPNGIDDDHNGYIDDLNGWNFLGDIDQENIELTRLVRKYEQFFSGPDSARRVTKSKEDFREYQKLKANLEEKQKEAIKELAGISHVKNLVDSLVTVTGKNNPKSRDFKALKGQNDGEDYFISVIAEELKTQSLKQVYDKLFNKTIDYYLEEIGYRLNPGYNTRKILGDDENNPHEKHYGNNNVIGPDALHGTHVAGIIGAVRDNKKGIDGIADQVEIIPVRCVPNGDERDKDVANAIRYATDMGAKVINMSFGKSFSPDKKVVDEAVRYALSKDVLLVHAAGNENLDLEKETAYPSKKFLNGELASAWIEVGASTYKADSTLKASFSNYGQTIVDVFAPGESIYSTVPGSAYQIESGTSMAAPVVSGLAALIRSYYPKLTAPQVKDIILKSVIPFEKEVLVEVGGEEQKVPFSSLSISGGVVNAYNALLLAESY
ncbi:S8 family peptidase [Pseudopedobacter beijingensis]|uniref:S8 family peptidase n=1 Tax=Pseudopedobacter beijingensis TaxID=1207056 RepID=A0ABW4IB78_9SPHI